MKQNTQPTTEFNLIVTRDNEPDADYLRQKHIEAVQAGLQSVLHTFTSPVATALHNARLNLSEELEAKTYDIFNGTHFHAQLKQQRLERRQAVAAKRFGILVK